MSINKAIFSLCALDGAIGEILGETCCASKVKLVKKFIEKIANNQTHIGSYLISFCHVK